MKRKTVNNHSPKPRPQPQQLELPLVPRGARSESEEQRALRESGAYELKWIQEHRTDK